MSAARKALKDEQPVLAASRLVFIDETRSDNQNDLALWLRSDGPAVGRETPARALENADACAALRVDCALPTKTSTCTDR